MRRFRRGILTAVLLVSGFGLAGCGSFDPTDMFHFLNTKKPIPGERQAVFPEGVPGVPQGVPPELVKGNPQEPDPAMVAEVSQPAPAVAGARPTARAKPRIASRPKVSTRPKQARKSSPVPATSGGQQPPQPDERPAQASAQPSSGDPSVWGPPPGAPQAGASTPWPAPAPRAPSTAWPDAPNPN
jgi:hypothetical protein